MKAETKSLRGPAKNPSPSLALLVFGATLRPASFSNSVQHFVCLLCLNWCILIDDDESVIYKNNTTQEIKIVFTCLRHYTQMSFSWTVYASCDILKTYICFAHIAVEVKNFQITSSTVMIFLCGIYTRISKILKLTFRMS